MLLCSPLFLGEGLGVRSVETTSLRRLAIASGVVGVVLGGASLALPYLMGMGLRWANDYTTVSVSAFLVCAMIAVGPGDIPKRVVMRRVALLVAFLCLSAVLVSIGWGGVALPLAGVGLLVVAMRSVQLRERSGMTLNLMLLGFILATSAERLSTLAYWHSVISAPPAIVATWIMAVIGGILVGCFGRARLEREARGCRAGE